MLFSTAIIVSSGLKAGTTEVTGALKHVVNELLKKSGAGAAASTELAEAIVLRELESATAKALGQGGLILGGAQTGEKIFVKTASAEWGLIFDMSGSIPRLYHAVPRWF